MEFLYGTSFMSQSPEAYERLIMDAMRGDATLFTRNDEVEAQWRICDPIVQAWSETPGPLTDGRAGGLPQYRGGLAGAARGGRPAARRPPAGGPSDLMASRQRRGLERAGHDARRDRSGAARAAGRAPRRERRLRPGARAQHGRLRRARVERRDRQPPARRRALPRLAPDRALLRPRPQAPGRARERRRRRRPQARASSRCCTRP